jgi:SAM-dependent methyltransferase
MADAPPTVDPRKFTSVAHARHRYFGPLSAARAAALIQLLELGPEALVLDAGCGQGAFLLELLRATGCSGLGVDVNPAFVARGRAAAGLAGLDGRVRFVEAPLAQAVAPGQHFSAVICMGASQAVGSLQEALRWAFAHLLPGGVALFADGFWRRPPPAGYLALLGAGEGDLTSHAGNARLARDAGFRVLCTAAASEEEWDEYEGLYCASVERHVDAHPDDPDAPAMAARIRAWHAGYLEWGRETLGYGFYVLLRPGAGP